MTARDICEKCLRPMATEQDAEGCEGGEHPDLCWGAWDSDQCWQKAQNIRESLPDRIAELEAENARLRDLLAQREHLPTICWACVEAGREPPRLEWNGETLACPECGADGMADDDD